LPTSSRTAGGSEQQTAHHEQQAQKTAQRHMMDPRAINKKERAHGENQTAWTGMNLKRSDQYGKYFAI
jgi:hypothetical protein